MTNKNTNRPGYKETKIDWIFEAIGFMRNDELNSLNGSARNSESLVEKT